MEQIKNKLIEKKKRLEHLLTALSEPLLIAVVKGQLLGVEFAIREIEKNEKKF